MPSLFWKLSVIPGAGRLYTKSLPKNQPLNFQRFPSVRGRFDGGEAIQDHMSLEVVVQQAFPLLSCAVAERRGTAITFRMPSGRCFPRSDRKSLTRQDGSLNKYQPDSQSLLRWNKHLKQQAAATSPEKSMFSKGRSFHLKGLWQKSGIGSTVYPLSPVLYMEPAWIGDLST